MVRLGQKVSTPHGPGMVVGFSRYYPYPKIWGCRVGDPVMGPAYLTSPQGPFAAVLVEGRICTVHYDDLNLSGRLGEKAIEMPVHLVGGDRDL